MSFNSVNFIVFKDEFFLLRKNLKKPFEGFKTIRLAILGDITSEYIQTPKNEKVRDHYKNQDLRQQILKMFGALM